MRYFLDFSYRGTDFHGSQTQPNAITVQQTLEQALATIMRSSIPLTFAGRTDAGVHARQMVTHFDWTEQLPANLVHRLNSLLPDSIAVRSIQPVTNEAHARFDAIARTYRYYITSAKQPFATLIRTRVAPGLDFESGCSTPTRQTRFCLVLSFTHRCQNYYVHSYRGLLDC